MPATRSSRKQSVAAASGQSRFPGHSGRKAKRVRLKQWANRSLLAAVVAGMLAQAHGQGGNQASITGTVSDATGAAIPNALVLVTNDATKQTRTITANSNGEFTAPALEPGTYSLSVTANGFEKSSIVGLRLDPGQAREANPKLLVGNATENVTVEAGAVSVETESSENAGVVTAKEVSNLMLNGRNFQTLGQIVPGVSSTSGGNQQGGGGLFGGTSLIINGQSIVYTLYTVDGVEDMNTGNLSNVNVLPIVDAIDEFRVVKDSFSAKYGFGGGAQVVIQTKSGSSTYHGSAWDYLRNNAFDARNYFNSATSPLHQNIFGYTVGGPLKIPGLYSGKKTFFFAANEFRRVNSGVTQVGAVLTNAQRAGNFNTSATLPTTGLTLDAHSTALLAASGKTNCITSRTTVNPSCFDPVAVSLLNSYFPAPNNSAAGFNNYLNASSDRVSQIDYNYRVDHYFNPNEVLTARALYEEVNDQFPYNNFDGSPFTTVAWNVYTTGANYMGRLTSTLTPHFVNVFTGAESYDKPRLNTPNETLPTGTTITQSYPTANTLNVIPHVTFSGGYSPLSTWYSPVHASDGEGIISDDITYTRGGHTLQAGIFYVFGLKNQNVFTYPQGNFSFSGVHTGDPAADFLLGLDATYTQNNNQKSGSFHYRQTEGYVQDDWKVQPRLTLNLGLRYTYFSSDTVTGNQVTSFFPTTYSASTAPQVLIGGQIATNASGTPVTVAGTTANTLDGIVTAGQNGVPNGFYLSKKDLFAPRVGFAYALDSANRSAVHGGYSFGYTRLPVQYLYLAYGQNPPFNAASNVLNSLLSNGTAGTGAAPTPQNLNTVGSTFKPAQLQTYSLDFQRQFSSAFVATIGYAGSTVHNIIGTDDINFPLGVSAPSTTGCLGTQAPSTHYDFDPCIGTGAASANYTRPYLGFGRIGQEASPGESNYNSLQFGAQYRAPHLQIAPSYTYSKALTNLGGRGAASGGSVTDDTVQNYRNYAGDYGPPSYDRTHVFSTSIVYDLPSPSHNRLLQEIAGGWSFAGLTIMESGYALTPGLATSTAGLAIRPNYAAPLRKVGTVNQWFSTASYAAPALGFFGNARTGSIRGPAEFVGNASLYKNFALYDQFHLQFRAEAFNIANHTNFANVETSLGSGNFGAVTSAQDPRILEFALKLTF